MITAGRLSREDWYTAKEAARQLGTTPLMVARMIRAGEFPGAKKRGRSWYVPAASVALVALRRKAPAWPRCPLGWHTVEEVSAITGRPPGSVYSWIRRGTIGQVDGQPGAVKDARGRWLISGQAIREIPLERVTVGNKLGWLDGQR